MLELLITKYRFYFYSGGIFLIIFITFLIVGINNSARAKDVELIAELKTVSNGLEAYYANFREYPQGNNIDLTKQLVLSDNGFGETDGNIYYNNRVTSGSAFYTSDGSKYEITFKLKRQWPVVGVDSGKDCVLINNYQINCGKNI